MSATRVPRLWLLLSAALLLVLGGPAHAFADDISLEGGDATTDDRTLSAFKHEAANLNGEESALRAAGDELFATDLRSPNGAVVSGLGPKFNSASCSSCHTNDGRGPVAFGASASQAIVRISLPQGRAVISSGVVPVPGIGTQLRDHALPGWTPDAVITLKWLARAGRYPDGKPYVLRKPSLSP